MNIQPLGPTTTPKLDDRPVAAAEAPATDAPKGAKATTEPAPTVKPTRDELDAAVKKLNASMSASAQTLEFSVDHDSKEIVVKMIDQGTKEVVRQIPSVEALQMAKSIDKMQGLLIHQTA